MYIIAIESKGFKELKDGPENGRNLRKGTCFDVYNVHVRVHVIHWLEQQQAA